MRKIDFIGIGAQKAGTTWVYLRLKELPDFSFPLVRDIHYFDRNKEYPSANTLNETLVLKRLKDIQWVRKSLIKILNNMLKGNIIKAKWLIKWYYMNYTDNWYLSLFKGINKLTGEFTPSYSFLKASDIKRIYKIAPHVKLVFIIRNPIERAWSQYRFQFISPSKKNEYHYTSKKQKHQYNSDNIENIIKFIDSKQQELRSNYVKTLYNYTNIYPKNQILIGFYDAIIDSPDELIRSVVGHIGGDINNVNLYCKLHQKNNVSPNIDIPEKIFDHLKKKYYDDIKVLSELFGGYCSKWLYDIYQEKSNNEENELLPTINLGIWSTNQKSKKKITINT